MDYLYSNSAFFISCFTKNREQPNIPLDKLFDFFKTLNSAPTPEECTISPSLYTEDVNRLNEHINYAITKDEISMPLRKTYIKKKKKC
jgi:hypothetical protein